MDHFELISEYKPSGDQPAAIEALSNGVNWGLREQTLLGVTGSGKTFTMAKVIERLQRPTLVLAHNKTLAAQLCEEFREFFPNNAVEYFVSYYDYYQPEAYLPTTDTYFSATMLSRDRARDEALAVLQTVLDSESATEESKTQALGDISRIALEIEQEANIESLIRARGFEDCIAVLSGESASIIVKSDTDLMTSHVAQISEIVYTESGVLPANVKIICK